MWLTSHNSWTIADPFSNSPLLLPFRAKSPRYKDIAYFKCVLNGVVKPIWLVTTLTLILPHYPSSRPPLMHSDEFFWNISSAINFRFHSFSFYRSATSVIIVFILGEDIFSTVCTEVWLMDHSILRYIGEDITICFSIMIYMHFFLHSSVIEWQPMILTKLDFFLIAIQLVRLGLQR